MEMAEVVNDPPKRSQILADCCTLVDQEVAGKSGLSGLSVKAGYAAVKGIKPGYIAEAFDMLLDEFAQQLDPILEAGKKRGDVAGYLRSNRSTVADVLLAITDRAAKSAKSSLVRGTYEKMRGTAKKHVEDAVPQLSKLLQKYME